MACVPPVIAAAAHVAVRALPAPLSAAAQPAMVAPASVKLTVPVGALPLTVAVKVTLAIDGFAELATLVVAPVLLTTWVSAALLDALLAPSPNSWRRYCAFQRSAQPCCTAQYACCPIR